MLYGDSSWSENPVSAYDPVEANGDEIGISGIIDQELLISHIIDQELPLAQTIDQTLTVSGL